MSGGESDTRKPEFDIYSFPQTWGSTVLGFGGIGGQAMASALTTVIFDETYYMAAVYFNGGFAYLIKNPNREFNDDLAKHNMAPVSGAGKYERRDE